MNKSLIPNNITVPEQFAYKSKLTTMFLAWAGVNKLKDLNLGALEQESGVRCFWRSRDFSTTEICGFELVDENKWAWFLLRWG